MAVGEKLHMSSQLFLQSMTVLISEKAASVYVWSLSRSQSSHRVKTQFFFLMRINAWKHRTSVRLTCDEGSRRSLPLLQHAALHQAEYFSNGNSLEKATSSTFMKGVLKRAIASTGANIRKIYCWNWVWICARTSNHQDLATRSDRQVNLSARVSEHAGLSMLGLHSWLVPLARGHCPSTSTITHALEWKYIYIFCHLRWTGCHLNFPFFLFHNNEQSVYFLNPPPLLSVSWE